MVAAIIIARGGSKRIPRKNARLFAGRPLVSYPIRACRDARLFDRIVVSTEDAEIAEISRQEGAEVPFLRPAELAADDVPGAAAVLHALRWLQDEGDCQHFCQLYPNPFISSRDLHGSYRLLLDSKAPMIIPMASYAFSIYRSFRITPEGRVEFAFQEWSRKDSHELPEAYHDVGQFYWCKTRRFLELEDFPSGESAPFLIPRHRAQDLNDPEDWTTAEKLYQAWKVEE